MNFSGKGASIGDGKLSVSKATLNPNAAEFVPFALRSPAIGINIGDISSKHVSSAASQAGKVILDRSESAVSNNSDEDAQQYWRNQLPDDITLDFNVMGIDDTQEINNPSLSNLSPADAHEDLRYSASTGSGFMLEEPHELSPHSVQGNRFAEKQKYPLSFYGEYTSPSGFHSPLPKPWDNQNVDNDQLFSIESPVSNGKSRLGFLSELSNGHSLVDNVDFNPLEFLVSQFPGFASESLAEVYFANGGHLRLTVEMLTQLELQVDGNFNKSLNTNVMSAPNLGALDFPSLSVTDDQNGFAKFDDKAVQQNVRPHRSLEKESTLLLKSGSTYPSRGATDFASVVRKMASQDSNPWKYDRSGSPHASIGSSRSSRLASSYNSDQGRGFYGDRLQNRGSAHASSVWLETGETVASMYSEMREEARDHAWVRNSYFEQARQAYLIGNKALAKELSIKGQVHNMQMKSAHEKAQDSIYHERNPGMQASERERMIDLHGLHVSEAIHVLKRELAAMKNAARSADQRYLAYICVGTGHHTRGLRTPARLPAAVQRYLLEEEGLDYSEPQAGLLRVAIY